MRLSPKDMRAVLSLALTKLRFWHIARERSGFDHIEFSSHINVKTYCRNNKKAVRGNKFFVTLSSLSEINTATDRREERRGVERAGVSSYRCCVRFPSLITSSGHLSLSPPLSPIYPLRPTHLKEVVHSFLPHQEQTFSFQFMVPNLSIKILLNFGAVNAVYMT